MRKEAIEAMANENDDQRESVSEGEALKNLRMVVKKQKHDMEELEMKVKVCEQEHLVWQ